jgi:hypothetical protein
MFTGPKLKRSRRPELHTPVRRGLALIEVVLAMAILTLVVIGVYRIVAAAMQTTAEVRTLRIRTSEIQAFIHLCENTLRTLPATAQLTGINEEEAGRYIPVLTFRNAPAAFAFGPHDAFLGPKSLRLVQQIGGLYRVDLILEEEEDLSRAVFKEPLPPLQLIKDLRSLAWQFYDKNTAQWTEAWENPDQRPSLVRLTMQPAELSTPMVVDFWLPELQRNQALPSPDGLPNNNTQDPPDTQNPPPGGPNQPGQPGVNPPGNNRPPRFLRGRRNMQNAQPGGRN